jgi:GAF domain-containing protein
MINSLDSEPARLAALARYEMLDTPREKEFDDIAALASAICEAPIAVVNLVGDRRQFFKAEVGLGVRETPFESSFCAKALLEEDVFVVPDATADARFDCNPLVTGEPHIRFYAGVLLKTDDGFPIGTLCVLDFAPRELTAVQLEALRVLARHAMAAFDLRLASKNAERDNARHRAIVDSATDFAIIVTDLRGVVTDWSAGAASIFGWIELEMIGQTAARIFTGKDVASDIPEEEMTQAVREGRGIDER